MKNENKNKQKTTTTNSNLVNRDLSFNQLNGTLPTEFGSLSALTAL